MVLSKRQCLFSSSHKDTTLQRRKIDLPFRSYMEKALRLLSATKDDDFGEEITHLDHCLQTYMFLRNKYPHDIELAVAGFWHDIGHSLHKDLEAPGLMLKDGIVLGVRDHDQKGADLFTGLLPDRVCNLIGLHTTAKRFIATTNNKIYKEKLSEASAETYHQEGGILSPGEQHKFRNNPLFSDALKLREGDDEGKDPLCGYKGGRSKVLLDAISDTLYLYEQHTITQTRTLSQDATSIRIAQSDTNSPQNIIGKRIFIEEGAGAGQYGTISSSLSDFNRARGTH